MKNICNNLFIGTHYELFACYEKATRSYLEANADAKEAKIEEIDYRFSNPNANNLWIEQLDLRAKKNVSLVNKELYLAVSAKLFIPLSNLIMAYRDTVRCFREEPQDINLVSELLLHLRRNIIPHINNLNISEINEYLEDFKEYFLNDFQELSRFMPAFWSARFKKHPRSFAQLAFLHVLKEPKQYIADFSGHPYLKLLDSSAHLQSAFEGLGQDYHAHSDGEWLEYKAYLRELLQREEKNIYLAIDIANDLLDHQLLHRSEELVDIAYIAIYSEKMPYEEMMSIYFKCGKPEKSAEVFNLMIQKNIIDTIELWFWVFIIEVHELVPTTKDRWEIIAHTFHKAVFKDGEFGVINEYRNLWLGLAKAYAYAGDLVLAKLYYDRLADILTEGLPDSIVW